MAVSKTTLAHLVGGGPADGWTLPAETAWPTICVPFGLTWWGPYYTLQYHRESVDPDGLLATYRFAGWPDELPIDELDDDLRP